MVERKVAGRTAARTEARVQEKIELSRLEIDDLLGQPIPDEDYGAGRTLNQALDEVVALYKTDDTRKTSLEDIRKGYETQLKRLLIDHLLGETLERFETTLRQGGIHRDHAYGVYFWGSSK
jgi:hypothetical protein